MAPAAVHDYGEANQKTVFIDTSLDTHLATVISDSGTLSDLKQKIMWEHRNLYPDIGDIQIECLKIKRRGVFYHLPDSTPIKIAFWAAKRNWYLSVDVSPLEKDGSTQHMDKHTVVDRVALPCVTHSHSINSTRDVSDVAMVVDNITAHEMPVGISQKEKDNELVSKAVLENEIPSSPMNTTSSKKRKRKGQKLKKTILSSSDIMESCENTSNKIIAGVTNCDMGSTGTTTIVENTPVSKKTHRKKKEQKSVGSNSNKITEVTEIIQVATLGKKLIIFDLNGLLADVVSPRPKVIKPDKCFKKRAIFKRPFLNDFMCFCLERFNVGIWSSTSAKVLEPILDFLLGDLKKKLLFCWDGSKCTKTEIRTLEDKHKYVVFKDLKKIWVTNDPHNSWVKGTFNGSNTLLLDDSPYKALLNPKHTGIFPVSYSYKNKDDDSLGPKGELRSYLEGLASADNVKTYVKQHPFGQTPIDEKDRNWFFYSRFLNGQYSRSFLTH